MPIYEYKCTNCNEIIDVIRSVSDPPLVNCPHCKLDSLVKLFSAPMFTLRGGGFYKSGNFQ
jgi:putative FmdB family regulatory protein